MNEKNEVDNDDCKLQINIKIILLGEVSIGKTSLINAFLGNQFQQYKTTITPHFSQKQVKMKEAIYNIDLWDTAGNEKFRSITTNFIRDSHIVIFVYDITERNTFTELDFWVNSAKELLGEDSIYGLAGNKIDLFENEKVKKEEGEKYAQKIGALFQQTSAKEDPEGFKNFVNQLLKEYFLKNNYIQQSESIITLNHQDKKRKKCC